MNWDWRGNRGGEIDQEVNEDAEGEHMQKRRDTAFREHRETMDQIAGFLIEKRRSPGKNS